jgi:hypothetical protein
MHIVIELFNISVLDLTSDTIRLQLQQLELQTRGIRAADALHASSAITFGADLLVSTDNALLGLDGILVNSSGSKVMCPDTDMALRLLARQRRSRLLRELEKNRRYSLIKALPMQVSVLPLLPCHAKNRTHG